MVVLVAEKLLMAGVGGAELPLQAVSQRVRVATGRRKRLPRRAESANPRLGREGLVEYMAAPWNRSARPV
jgi:hypothetical protein